MNKFIVKKSKLDDESYYIECNGSYKITEISTHTGISKDKLNEMYNKYEGRYNDNKSLYYFSDYNRCVSLVEELNKNSLFSKNQRTISLTEEEIEYIRRALINEDSNIIFTNGKIRDSIFRKLNS